MVHPNNGAGYYKLSFNAEDNAVPNWPQGNAALNQRLDQGNAAFSRAQGNVAFSQPQSNGALPYQGDDSSHRVMQLSLTTRAVQLSVIH